MGITSSKQTPSNNIFQKELKTINTIVTSILNENDTFKNKDYNFLSQDVCNKYQIVLESELSKHLKVQLADFGSTLYLIPSDDRVDSKIKMTKGEICEKISSHYISILYIITLIKYIYDLENHGDRSFGGIILRNIQIVDNMMKIIYCDTEQKDGVTASKAGKMNLNTLNGFKFFTQYILNADEARVFMKLMRAILAKKPKGQIRTLICQSYDNRGISKEEFMMLQALYERKYQEQFTYNKASSALPSSASGKKEIDTVVTVVKENPVFSQPFCSAINEHSISLNTKEGKVVKKLYDEMHQRYRKNIECIFNILQRMVVKQGSEYMLKNIDSNELNKILEETKICVRRFYIQAIMDYHHMLDTSKNIPHLKLNINSDGLF